tara:strand:- start:496 stop:846 length:351 start_codon:yes stop_codon:yes gene_type:complete
LEAIPSPALLIIPDRVEANVDRMLAMVGGDATRLRPHVKTHKMAEVLRLQVAKGIAQFKCATIAEAEMTAMAGGARRLVGSPAGRPQRGSFSTVAGSFFGGGFFGHGGFAGDSGCV